MHPENFDNFGGIDNNLNKFQKLFPEQVEINADRFEDTTNLADAFVFYYTSTSTLYNALISNKPIFYFDTKISQMTNNMSSNLEKFYKKRSTRLAKYLLKCVD